MRQFYNYELDHTIKPLWFPFSFGNCTFSNYKKASNHKIERLHTTVDLTKKVDHFFEKMNNR